MGIFKSGFHLCLVLKQLKVKHIFTTCYGQRIALNNIKETKINELLNKQFLFFNVYLFFEMGEGQKETERISI